MIRATVLRALVLTAAFAAALTPVTCLGEDSNPTRAPKELPAKPAKELPAKEDAKTFTDPCAYFQGRGGTRSLETGHHRPFPVPEGLPGLSVVGRSWAE